MFDFRCFPCLGDFDRSCFPIRRGRTGSECVPFVRSFPVCQGEKREERQQISNITSYIDASMVYGSTEFVLSQVRDGNSKLFNMFYSAICRVINARPSHQSKNYLDRLQVVSRLFEI